jgi:hypothetical protein
VTSLFAEQHLRVLDEQELPAAAAARYHTLHKLAVRAAGP